MCSYWKYYLYHMCFQIIVMIMATMHLKFVGYCTK